MLSLDEPEIPQVQAHKLKVTVPESHHLEIRLPDDFPLGPAEVIVLADSRSRSSTEEARRDMLAVLEELRTTKLTEEEKRVLDDFEQFREKEEGMLHSPSITARSPGGMRSKGLGT